MKRFFMILATVASVAVGCTKNGLEPVTPEVKIGSYSLKAVISEATKTSVDNEGKMAWVTGDKIAVYDCDFEEFTLKGEATGAEATFTGDIYYPEEACVAVCPFDIASEVADEILTVNLPFSYEYDGQSTHAPMIATGFSFTDKEATLKFKHIGGLFKVTYNNIPEEAKYFCFESETNQIAGEFYIEDYKAANTSIEVGSKPEDGNIVSYTISSMDDHSSMSFFVPVPVGTFDFNISLRDAENNKIAKSSKTKRGFTIARGDYVDIPAVNMPKTLTENFNSTACTTDASKKYGSILAFSDANVKGFDFTWKAGTGSQNIFDGGIKLGAVSKAGDVTSSDILNDIAKGTNFTVLVYASGWASTPNLTVSYNNMDLTYALTQQIESPNEKTYSASDFVKPVEYVFQKADATDLKISVAKGDRVIIDKIIIKEGGELPEKTYSVTIANNIENGSVSANPSANVLPGTEVTLTATPATGYEFDSWNVTNASTSEEITITDDKFTMPDADVNVSAAFKEIYALKTMDEIFAAATSAGATATDTKVTFNNWVVSGIKQPSNVYVTDGTKGLLIYASGHGFEVGDVLSGTVNCKVQLFNGASELTNLTSATDGLNVTKGGVITPSKIDIANLGGVNTGAVITFESLTYTGTAFTDGTNEIKPYNTFISLPTLTLGRSYQVSGVYIQFKDTKEIAPRTEEDIIELSIPYLTASADKTSGIAATGETIFVTVDTNVEVWSVVSDNDAFTIKNQTKKGFEVEVSENTDTEKGREAEITVSADGVDDVVISLTQNKKTTGGDPVTKSVDLTAQGYSNGQEVKSVDIDNNVNVVFDKGTNSSNAPKYYTSGTAVRCYGGNTISVKAAGKIITAIKLTFGSSDGSNAITTDVDSFTSPNWSGESETVVFTIGGTSGNRRITRIEVTYR